MHVNCEFCMCLFELILFFVSNARCEMDLLHEYDECSEILRGRSKYNCTYLMRQYDEYKTNYHIAKRIWRKRYYSYCIKDASVRLAWKKDLSFIHHEWLIWLMSSVTVFPCNSLKQSVQVHACAFLAALLSWIWKPQLLLHIHYFHQGEC